MHLSTGCKSGQALIKDSLDFPAFVAAAPCWGIHQGLAQSQSVRSNRKKIFCPTTLPPPCLRALTSLVCSLRCLCAPFTHSERLSVRGLRSSLNLFGCTLTRVCLASEGAQLTLNSSPPGIRKWEVPSVVQQHRRAGGRAAASAAG